MYWVLRNGLSEMYFSTSLYTLYKFLAASYKFREVINQPILLSEVQVAVNVPLAWYSISSELFNTVTTMSTSWIDFKA